MPTGIPALFNLKSCQWRSTNFSGPSLNLRMDGSREGGVGGVAPPERCLSKLPPIIMKGRWIDMTLVTTLREIPCPLKGREMSMLSLERTKQGIQKVLTRGKRIWFPSFLPLLPLGPSTLVAEGLVREDKSTRYSLQGQSYNGKEYMTPVVDQGHERDQLGHTKRQKWRPVSRVPCLDL